MKERSRAGRRLWALAAFCLLLGLSLPGRQVQGVQAVAAMAPAQPEGRWVVPVGKAVGIKMFSDGVLVVGLSGVDTPEGQRCPGRDCGLKTGDVITHINGSQVDTIEQVQALVARQRSAPLTIQAMRGSRQMQLSAAAVEDRRGEYHLGVWLRDSMAGIGTMTFYDPKSGQFAALGHGVNDVDTALLLPLERGSIMPAQVSDVKKGAPGAPGELHGQFDLSHDLGELYANTSLGIFGRMDPDAMGSMGALMETAQRQQVREGPAEIWSNIRGDQVERFQVQILRVDHKGTGKRDLTISVTDPGLLQGTGGIVQGMSGSPIIQDGRLVGAVTHVLVDDPARGYGVLIENMLAAAQ